MKLGSEKQFHKSKKKGNKTHDEPMREQLYEKFGVDLTAVEGVSMQTCLAFLGEVGTDVEKFATAEHFASWMGLCPDNRITGGRTHAAHTRKVQNRLANALRMAAQSLQRSKAGLGDWFRRLKAKLGTKAAVTAAAHSRAERDRHRAEPLPEGHRRRATATWRASSGPWSNTVDLTTLNDSATPSWPAPAKSAIYAAKSQAEQLGFRLDSGK